MSKIVQITSTNEFKTLISSSKTVLVDFYADWCGPCKTIAPFFEQLSAKYSRPQTVTFAKVNTDQQTEVAQQNGITAMPTFVLFQDGKPIERIQGANPKALESLAQRASKAAEGGAGSSSGGASGTWSGASIARGYADVTDQIDTRGLDLLNADSDFGSVRTLFETSKPSGLNGTSKGKGKSTDEAKESSSKDWVESDTDPQLMLFVPFQSTMKIHSLQVTSLPLADSADDDEAPTRPKTIHLYTNRSHNLGFEEAEDTTPVQTIEISDSDWDAETGTANVELRFVKFQNVSSLVVFVVDGANDSEKTRVDRIRLIGESGASRSMGKLEKIGDEAGE